MPSPLDYTCYPADPDFTAQVVEDAISFFNAVSLTQNKTSFRFLAPSLALVSQYRSAFARALAQAHLPPQFTTLSTWINGSTLPENSPVASPVYRRFLLYEALSLRGWFEENTRFGIAAEILSLCDALSAQGKSLPESEAMLIESLESAYALRASLPLHFEARVVHDCWRALYASGALDDFSAYRLRLSATLSHAQSAEAPAPLFLILETPPEEALLPAERAFLEHYADHHPVRLVFPSPRENATHPRLALLDTAWSPPILERPPLAHRAEALKNQYQTAPFQNTLEIIAATGREHEAQIIVGTIAKWLESGLRHIALIAEDRLTARRARALLEREGILISDETGWRLSTSRAAASVDAFFETLTKNTHYRDLLDLFKSPFIFGDLPPEEKESAVLLLESFLRKHSLKQGLTTLITTLHPTLVAPAPPLLSLLSRLASAHAIFEGRPVSAAAWIQRLEEAIDLLGLRARFEADSAGREILLLLDARRSALAESTLPLSFSAWRQWLNSEFESSNFRDTEIDSPFIMCSLRSTRLRPFEAAILMGADETHLSGKPAPLLFNRAVAQELGLPTPDDERQAMRRDLELLLLHVPKVLITWQAESNGEHLLLAPEFDLLSICHQMAWGDDLYRAPPPLRLEVPAAADTAPHEILGVAPTLPSNAIPLKISVSAYKSLIDCPYQFFARYAMQLNPQADIPEEIDKRDYGARLHLALENFHTAVPIVSALSQGDAQAALQRAVSEAFAPLLSTDLLAHAWSQRFEKRIISYLAWQRSREAQGWFWNAAEKSFSRTFPLALGHSLELHGRVDRIDEHRSGGHALIDYKTQTVERLKKTAEENIQLNAYALLDENATQTAYVALDDETVKAVGDTASGEALSHRRTAEEERLIQSFEALYAGHPLPAHGEASLCAYCEMSGLCRKEFRDVLA